MAVASGDEIVFVTADSLQADSQIRVVPGSGSTTCSRTASSAERRARRIRVI